MQFYRGRTLCEYIEIDNFIELVILQYQKMSDKETNNIVDLFVAADLDYNGLLTFDEFDMIVNATEPQITDKYHMQKIFTEFSDVTDDSLEYLSIEKLASLSVQNKLFTTESISKLLKKPINGQFTEEGELVKKVFARMKEIFIARLKIVGQPIEEWNNKLNQFTKRFNKDDYSAKCIFF